MTTTLQELKKSFFAQNDELNKEAAEGNKSAEETTPAQADTEASSMFGEMMGHYLSEMIEETQEKIAAAMHPAMIPQNYDLEADKALAKSMDTARLQAIVKAQFAGSEVGKVK